MYIEKLKEIFSKPYSITDYAIGMDNISTKTKVIFVGKTPFAEKAGVRFSSNGFEVEFLDKYEEGEYQGIPIFRQKKKEEKDTLYIHCSRPHMDSYIKILDENDKQSVYQQLLISSTDFDSHPFAYTHEKTVKQAEHIWNCRNEYMELLDVLEDKTSKELLARILLFRLTFDYRLHKDIKSSYPHYFERDIFSFSDKEVFVDGGGFIGDTLQSFLKECDGKFQSYYLFEPEEALYRKAVNISQLPNVHYINAGLLDKENVLHFQNGEGTGNGTIVLGGGQRLSG